MLVFTMVKAPPGGELPARSGWSRAGAAPLGERQNAGICNGFSMVLRRSPGQVWLVRRRRGPPRRAPEGWYLQWF